MSRSRDGLVLPYHFVPVHPGERRHDVPYRELDTALDDGAGHHFFADGRRSGRLVCRLETVSPTLVGAERQSIDDGPDRIENFAIEGQPALPASSLRGMVSAVAEAASKSAMRVLDDRAYSYRAPAGHALSAVGEVVIRREGGRDRYLLRPLTLPVLKRKEVPRQHFEIPEPFRDDCEVDRLCVLIPHHDSKGQDLVTWSREHPVEYGLMLHRLSATEREDWKRGVLIRDPKRHKLPKFLIAQKVVPGGDAAPTPWESIPQRERGRYVRGIVRSLWTAERHGTFPGQRKYELFIPRDPSLAEDWTPLPIEDAAVERFHELADERTEASREGGLLLPYEPVGTARNLDAEKYGDRFRLKDGDLVYFKHEQRGETWVASELSLSKIWRRRVEDGGKPARAWRFFQAVDPDLVPFHAGRVDGKVTLAEQLFGFVSEDGVTDEQQPTPALASRLSFSYGHLAGEESAPYMAERTLRILDSPKPPSPALYFEHDRRGAIGKQELCPERHRPQGHKRYVHQRWDPEKGAPPPWETRDFRDPRTRTMKARARPLREGLAFYFHIDFVNLTNDELGLLLYALEPTPAFLHKLGAGKPLGLGSVKVEVAGVFEVDRPRRYSADGFFQPRYHRAFLRQADAGAWPSAYAEESRAAAGDLSPWQRIEALKESWHDGGASELRAVLERLGEAVFEPHEVSVPLVVRGHPEKETFEWFVANEQPAARQRLEPLRGSDGEPPEKAWPRLPRLPSKKSRRR